MRRSWRCFHCDEVFRDTDAAAIHFGDNELCTPACGIDAANYRRMERYYQRCLSEDSDSEREFHAMQSKHDSEIKRAEQLGYERGLRDARKAEA